MAEYEVSKKLEKRRELHQLDTGQAREGATGACTTICIFVASYFCSLDEKAEVLEEFVSSLIIRGSIRWRSLIGEWTSVTYGCALSLMAGMVVRFERMNRPRGTGRVVVDLKHNLISGMRLFSKPVALFFCSTGYTYVFLFRRQCRDIYFFDPHGNNAIFDRIKDLEDLLYVIKTACRISEKNDYDMLWVQHRAHMDHFRR